MSVPFIFYDKYQLILGRSGNNLHQLPFNINNSEYLQSNTKSTRQPNSEKFRSEKNKSNSVKNNKYAGGRTSSQKSYGTDQGELKSNENYKEIYFLIYKKDGIYMLQIELRIENVIILLLIIILAIFGICDILIIA